ncbi:MAG: endonuclease/exonuclease/phosphatase family protein [Opitutaceae bacterium]|nr:endonuclease/exonuclease/phosphatase family protein [Opitutaceae bacterium]
MTRIASFNVENLFERPRAFGATQLSVAKPILDAYREVNGLFGKASYTAADKAKMKSRLLDLDIYTRNAHGAIRRKNTQNPKWAWLRKNRGAFDREPQDPGQDVEIIATGRSDWIGWVELATEPVNEIGTRMTARVIQELNADIIGIVEAEDRPSLLRFNEELLGGMYRHIMLIDGNDERGIDVAILTKVGFEIESVRSNVDAEDSGGIIFSRDCAQYGVRTPGGTSVHILVNHFKSQSGGGGAKRRRQAVEVRRIADGLVQQGQNVVVLGDLNEGPTQVGAPAQNLSPLYDAGSPLIECYALPGFDAGGRPGSFDSCTLRNRLDYIFVSAGLQSAVAGGGLFRKGLWGDRPTRPTAWVTFPEITRSVEQASDHSAVFVDFNF